MKIFFTFLYLVGLGIIMIGVLSGFNIVFDLNLEFEGSSLPKDWYSAIALLIIGLIFSPPGYVFSSEKTIAFIKKNKILAISAFALYYILLFGLVASLIYYENKDHELFLAIEQGNIKKVKLALSKEPTDTEFLNQLFLRSIRYKKPEVAEYLLSLGAEPEFFIPPVEKNQTPLLVACYTANANIVRILLAQKTNKKIRGNIYDGNLIHETIMGINNSQEKIGIIELLLKEGLDINDKDMYERTPLSRAVEVLDAKLIEFLLVKQADPNIVDKDGRNPLHHLILFYKGTESEKLEILKILLKYNITANLKDTFSKTPGDMAKRKNYFNLLQLLKEVE